MKKQEEKTDKATKKRKGLSYYVGRYSAPEFLNDWKARREEQKKNPEFAANRRATRKKIALIGGILLALVAVAFGALLTWRFIESRRPQPLRISYRVDDPDPTDPQERRPNPLVLSFRGSAAPLNLVGQEPTQAVTLSPDIPGTWIWEDDDRLVFTPDRDWPIGEEFNGRFPDGFFPEHVEVEKGFSFAIQGMDVRITSSEFYIDPTDSAIKRILATIRSPYPLNEDSLRQRVSIEPDLRANSGSLENRPYEFTLTLSEDGKEAYVVSEALGTPADDVTMDLVIESGVASLWEGHPASEGASRKLTVPGISSFVRVSSLTHDLVPNESQGFDQILALETRGTIFTDDLLQGLSVRILPIDRPDLPGLPGRRNHHWGDLDELVPTILSSSQEIPLEAIPNEEDHSAVNSFRFSAEPGRYLYVKLEAGTSFFGGYDLAEDFERIVQVKTYPRELGIVSQGTLLSMSGDRTLALLSRGVPSVSYRIGRIRPDDINHIITQSNGDLRNFHFQNYRFDEDNVIAISYDRENLALGSPDRPTYFSFDFNNYLRGIPEQGLRYGLFFFEVSGQGSYSQYRDKRLLMVTDLGLYVKTADDGRQAVFVQSIASGNPVSGVRVQVLGVNGNPVAEGITDRSGFVEIPNLSSLSGERQPVVFVATRGNDMSFLPYQGAGRYLDYSSFDVGGVRGSTDPETLNAYLFSDRGIYRPGDEIRIGMIVKAGDWSVNPQGTPLECHITDSRGQTVHVERITLSSAGFEEVRYRSQAYSPTGLYDASLYVKETDRYGNVRRIFLGSTEVKVEEFLPDNLEVDARILPLPGDGWAKPENLTGLVSVRNLFGTPAVEARVDAELTLTPGYRRFRGYEDFRFFDPYLQDNRFTESLGTRLTDDDGAAEFPLDLGRFETASYNLTFSVEAFEKGSGRSVSHEARTFVSPLDSIIGYRSDGRLDYISLNSVRQVDFIALGQNLDPVDRSDLELSLEEVRYVSILVRQPNGVYKYQSVERPEVVETRPFTLSDQGGTVSLSTDSPGDYVLRLRDDQGNEVASLDYTVAGTANLQRSLDRTAELEISLAAQDYAPGDSIEIFIKAPYQGAGLITIERDQVYAHQWFQSEAGASVQRIRLPEGLEGNGYVTVSYLRSQDSPEVFMSPLSYGTVPFSVSREAQTNVIELEIPEEAKPGQPLVIGHRSSRNGKIVVFAVDEGILQVAGYQTPDPLAFFFRKRALEVRTAQILDLVLPEYSVIRSLAAIGGGAGADDFLSRNLNPFRRRSDEPVAYWSGVIDSGPQGGTVTYNVPGHFNGTLRVMAVAVSSDAIGAVEERTIIRDTFVIRPNAPLAATPGDEFEVAVTVANNQDGSGNQAEILLEAQPTEHLEILNGAQRTLAIDEGRDVLEVFRVRATGPLGGGEIEFRASGRGETSVQRATMSIRPPTPFRTTLYSGVVRSGSDGFESERQIREEFADQELALSYLPLAIADGLYYYLSKFPHGCTEQIISSTFPLLYQELAEQVSLSESASREKIGETIGILQARQKDDGSLGLWTSRSESNPHIDAYAALFLSRARDLGYSIPDPLFDSVMERLENVARSREYNAANLRNRAFAIYALTADQRVTTSYIETLVEDLDDHGEADWETDFTGLFLAASYALLQQDRQASALLGRIKRDFRRSDSGIYLDELGFSAFYLFVLSEHFPRRLDDAQEELLTSIADALGRGLYTTISANFVLMGIDAYVDATPDAGSGEFSVTERRRDGTETLLVPQGDPLFLTPIHRDTENVTIRNRGDLNLFWQATQGGFDSRLPEEAENHGIEAYRVFQNQEGENITEFELGIPARAVLRLRSIQVPVVEQVAVVDMLPAGFEADIESLRSGGGSGGWRPDYIDIREDRVVFYGVLDREMAEFTYTVRPVSRGTFVSPPVFAEAMYDRDTWSMNPADPVLVR